MHRLILSCGIFLLTFVFSFGPEESVANGKKSEGMLIPKAEMAKGVGNSLLMPYWRLSFGGKHIPSDLIAVMNERVGGKGEVAQAILTAKTAASGTCPQPRKTQKAPGEFLQMENPLRASNDNVKAGEKLYFETAKPLACVQCHGKNGDGRGPLGAALVPPPRDFSCGEMMQAIPDGQLFWVIKNGSPGTGMMATAGISDEEIWQMIHYLRHWGK